MVHHPGLEDMTLLMKRIGDFKTQRIKMDAQKQKTFHYDSCLKRLRILYEQWIKTISYLLKPIVGLIIIKEYYYPGIITWLLVFINTGITMTLNLFKVSL